jgi:amino acid adenylation domain-containing protein
MSFQGGRLRRKLNSELTEALRKMGRQEKTSLFTIFAAALDTLLYRYSGSDDILLGIPLADRDRQELQSVVGFLLHTHVLRARLAGEMSFRDLLSRVQKAVLDLYVHRAAPFDQVVRKLQLERNLSYTPLFQVMLNWRDRDQSLPFIGLEGLAIESMMATAATSKFDLYLFATDNGDEIWLELEYNADLFNEDRIARMLNHYQVLLESAAEDPAVSIAKLRFLTTDEYQQIVVDWNRTDWNYPEDESLDGLIDAQIKRTPDATAVVFRGEQLTYRQLGDRADQLASYLQELGVGRNILVAICVERSLEMMVGLLGILRAGGAYLPLDPTFPPDRLAFMLKDAQPLVLLTQEKLRALLPSQKGHVVSLDAIPAEPPRHPIKPSGRRSSDLAYVLYTSGSTGTPKGVQIQHSALVNFLTSMQREPGITADDTLLAITTLSFDIAGLEFYLPLSVGARLVIASSEAVMDGRQLSALMKGCAATVMQATPVTWRMLLDSGWPGRPALKILCGGESWGTDLADELLPRCQSLWNMYGPTETTIWSSVSRVEKGQPVLIGKPIANTEFYVLDSTCQPLPVGIPGELFIGGRGLASGYLGRPELTSERFVTNPYSPQVGARLYKTGDLVRRLPDGAIEFLRRADHQVKLRGFRIELGEIETSLQQHPGISQCVVTVRGDGLNGKILVAHIVATDARNVPTVEDLNGALKQRLPNYMIPATFSVIEKMPLTPNGKIDRKALSESTLTTAVSEVPFEAPRDSIEVKLVQIWERLLEFRPIGVRANFFDVGGYSLLVVKLFAQIDKVFHCSLPIVSIFSSPTIEQLATLIRGRSLNSALNPPLPSGTSTNTNSSIVPIQPHGSEAPLFIVHGRLGNVLRFYQLAMLINANRPIYGIQAQSLLAGHPALLRLEDQAAYYVSEIRKVQPKGPYSLLGYSFGGTAAFEIAQQLHALGERVEMLGLLDAQQRESVVVAERNDSAHRLDRRIVHHVGNLGRLSLWKKAVYLREKLQLRILTRVYIMAANIGIRSVPSFMKNTFYISRAAAMNYRARPWPGQVSLFRASVQRDPRLPRDLGWESVAEGGVEVYELPGDHNLIFQEPNVRVLAEQLRMRLQRPDATPPVQLQEPAYSPG